VESRDPARGTQTKTDTPRAGAIPAKIMQDQFDMAGDCLAVDFDRCPVCGEIIWYCQGHGEIGDPEGFAILQAHNDDDHERCLKVKDVFSQYG
jgi:hypothetical protein